MNDLEVTAGLSFNVLVMAGSRRVRAVIQTDAEYGGEGLMPPRAERRPQRPTADEIRAQQERADAQAKEVLEHMYHAFLKTPEFTLRDGTKCRVDAFYKPEVNDEGELKCGLDVVTDSGHLEFTVGHTGWGKRFAPPDGPKKPEQGRRR